MDSSGIAVVSGWGWCDPGFGRALSACNGCSKRLAFPQTPSANEFVLGEIPPPVGLRSGNGRSVGDPLTGFEWADLSIPISFFLKEGSMGICHLIIVLSSPLFLGNLFPCLEWFASTNRSGFLKRKPEDRLVEGERCKEGRNRERRESERV